MHHLTRRFTFSAAHRLHNAEREDGWNRERYGPCNEIHGHNYALEVTVRGSVDPQVGFFCNVVDLGTLVTEAVVAPCDHKLLEEVSAFADLPVTTMENVVTRIWQILEPQVAERGAELYEVVLAESEASRVSLRRES